VLEFPAARLTDPVTHDMLTPSGVIGPPLAPPIGGLVIIEGMPAAYVTCTVQCAGTTAVTPVHPPLPPGTPPPPIITGSSSVLINGMPAARWAPSGDMAACGTFLGDPKLTPMRTVWIGGPSAPGAPSVPSVGAPGAPSAGGGGGGSSAPPSVRAASATAASSRTPGGLVDPAAVRSLASNAPALDTDGPGGVKAGIEKLAAESLGRNDLAVQQLAGGAGKGQSGAPVFLVRDSAGELVAIGKIFPAVDEMVRELSAMDRLSAAEFTSFKTPAPLGVAVGQVAGRQSGAMIMSVAPGLSLFDMIAQLPAPGSPERPAASAELTQAVRDSGSALAELHSRPANSGGPVNREFLEFNHNLAKRETAAVAAHERVLQQYGLNGATLKTRMDEVVAAALAEPGGAAVMHGDAHPGNIFWHPTAGVTLIDTPHAHFSMDQAGGAIGTPARDYANMQQRISHFGAEAGLSRAEIDNLQANFADAYASAGGPAISPAALKAYSARYAMRDSLDTMNALEDEGLAAQEVEKLHRQLGSELQSLRVILGLSA
jgi:aminoglycoside phosphotransferase (APT) family kinase protein/uncharacterized Zn-binding protein involved in type VI secretion